MIWIQFLLSAGVIVFAAIKLAQYGDIIAVRTRLSGMFIGTLLLAGATSLPELLSSLNALAIGEPNLAAGSIFGSSMFNMFMLALLDLLNQQARILRQVAMNRFEDACHTARREQGELTTEQINNFWLETQRDEFKDSVTLREDYGVWWSYVSHFISVPGYVYAYAFGELLVLALYARYEASPDGFAEKYSDVLSAGGSDWPHEIVAPLGVDLTDPDFWSKGLNMLDEMVTTAEKLAEEVG